jgi:FkbM family methyltransferase
VYLRPRTNDSYVFRQIFLERQYEIRVLPHFERVADFPDDQILIVDCGAYTGLSTLWFAQTFPRAKIYAIEPDADNYDLLVRNTAGLNGVTPVRAAVWDKRCSLSIANPGPDTPKWAIRMEECNGDRAGSIDATTIPALMQSASDYRCVIVKIDIEGGEAALFRSNTGWLAETDVLLIELHDWLYPWCNNSRNLLNAILKYNFEVVLLGENLICFRREAARIPGELRTLPY